MLARTHESNRTCAAKDKEQIRTENRVGIFVIGSVRRLCASKCDSRQFFCRAGEGSRKGVSPFLGKREASIALSLQKQSVRWFFAVVELSTPRLRQRSRLRALGGAWITRP